ncbi:hypothetical protein BpHYR1_037133 [Brachionus plicatilis]|uniref:Uncharacterized protein n=1 Tax=Brachionus plicatilis TaxID=10195 RepID=A0A3M7P5V7_BRAPC|nr:hypothetical protein BpHYR1_037133 [Brachionus plicatilis]
MDDYRGIEPSDQPSQIPNFNNFQYRNLIKSIKTKENQTSSMVSMVLVPYGINPNFDIVPRAGNFLANKNKNLTEINFPCNTETRTDVNEKTLENILKWLEIKKKYKQFKFSIESIFSIYSLQIVEF